MTTSYADEIAVRSPLTSDEVEAFTEGDCWLLAEQLHALGAGDLVFLSPLAVADGFSFADLYWEHALIRRPDGSYLDAYGISTEAEMRKLWRVVLHRDEAVVLDVPSVEAFKEATRDQSQVFDDQDYVSAAKRLYDTYCN